MSVRLRIRFGLMIPVLGALALAACAGPSPPRPMAGTGTSALSPASYSPPPDSTSPALPPAPGDLARGADRFEGLAGNDIIAALGDPNFRRRETPAEVWQYFGPGCILDLFLYDDAPGAAKGDGKVEHAELRGRPGQQPEAACLGKLIDERRHQRASISN